MRPKPKGLVMPHAAIPLSQDQIAAANRIHDQPSNWLDVDSALIQLGKRFPEFDSDACLLKTAAINSFYGTNIFAINRVARHVMEIMSRPGAVARGADLVNDIAKLTFEKKNRFNVSFAAKFCHFFVDENQFPVYDEAARKALRLHLGKDQYVIDAGSYDAFCENLSRLRKESDTSATPRQLDRYLWITGQFYKYVDETKRHGTSKINKDLQSLIKSGKSEVIAELKGILPDFLQQEYGLLQMR